MQEGTFVIALISGEARPAVFTGGVVHVIGSMASPAPEPPASSTPPAPSFCRGCSKELTITPWQLQKFAEHGHWLVRCYVCNAKHAAAFQPVAPAQAGGLPSVGGSNLRRRSLRLRRQATWPGRTPRLSSSSYCCNLHCPHTPAQQGM